MLFDRWADWYDALYREKGKDYAREAVRILAIAHEHVDDPGSLLDVACGTGAHLAHFRSSLRVTGVDWSDEMLAIAARAAPDATLHRADMRDFNLGARFDVVTCLFGSTGYLATEEDLGSCVARMRAHVSPGGVVIVEPPPFPDSIAPAERQVLEASTADGSVRRVTTAEFADNVLRIRFEFEVTRGSEAKSFVEEHPIRLFELAEYELAFSACGLSYALRDGLLIGLERKG